MEVKRLQSRLVQMENSLTVAHQGEEKAKEELARLRQVHLRHCQSMLALGHKFEAVCFRAVCTSVREHFVSVSPSRCASAAACRSTRPRRRQRLLHNRQRPLPEIRSRAPRSCPRRSRQRSRRQQTLWRRQSWPMQRQSAPSCETCLRFEISASLAAKNRVCSKEVPTPPATGPLIN